MQIGKIQQKKQNYLTEGTSWTLQLFPGDHFTAHTCLVEGLDWVTLGGPFQPKFVVILYSMAAQSNTNHETLCRVEGGNWHRHWAGLGWAGPGRKQHEKQQSPFLPPHFITSKTMAMKCPVGT